MNGPPPTDFDATMTSVDAARVFPPGAVVAERYRIVELLGIGGMGMVYHALDEHLELPVALKMLRPERSGSHEMLARFKRELILARQVSHKNVVRIHDIGQDGDLYFLTMDFVPGRSLKEILEAEGPLPYERAVAIFGQLAAALDAAHAEGVVHRDLKPANVLIDDEEQAYVTDFGIARAAGATALTATGGVVGTPDYLSPEQARGEQVDARTDVYALGLILFEMLSGRTPFAGGTLTEVLAQRISGRPVTLAEAGVEAPAVAEAVIRRCLARDPDARYPNAGEAAADLEAGRAPTRLWPTLTVTGRRMTRAVGGRRRWPLAAVLVALIAALAFALWPRDAAPPAGAAAALHAIAVLPLADETGRADLAWISTGLAEMVAEDLAASPELRVVEGMRVFRTLEDLKIAPGPLPAADLEVIAELLDVDRLVVGQVRASGATIRLDAQLVAVDSPGFPAEKIRVEVARDGEIFRLAERLGDALRERLGASRGAREAALGAPAPAALAAFTAALEARLEGDNGTAAEALEQAVAASPDFAAAWADLAEVYDRLGFADRARAAAETGVALLPADEAPGRLALRLRARQAALAGDVERAEALLRQLIERFPHDMGARVALGETVGNGGDYETANAVLAEVVARDPNHPFAWYLLGKFAILQGDNRRAIDEYLTRALVIQNRLGNRQEQATVLNAFGIAYQKLGDLDEAAARYRQAATLHDQVGDARAQSRALFNLASIYSSNGDHEKARESLDQVLEIRRRIGDRAGIASAENLLGTIAEQQGQMREALEHYRRGLDLRRELADRRAIAESLANVGFTHYLLGEHEEAIARWGEARELFEETGNREGGVLVAQNIAQLELARGHWDRALATLLEILEASRELDFPAGEALAKGYLGRVAQYQGRFRAARSSYAEALELLAELRDLRGLVEFTLADADALLELGHLDAAGERLEQARSWLDETENREQRAELWRLDGELQQASGRPREAAATFARAVAEARASGSRTAELWTRLSAERVRIADDPRGAAAALEEIVAESTALGHLMLRLRGRAALARARLATGDAAAAEVELGRALALGNEHRPIADAYRLHLAHAELLRARGAEAAARTELDAASRQLERLRANLDPAARELFDRLPEVEKIDRETENQSVAVAERVG